MKIATNLADESFMTNLKEKQLNCLFKIVIHMLNLMHFQNEMVNLFFSSKKRRSEGKVLINYNTQKKTN